MKITENEKDKSKHVKHPLLTKTAAMAAVSAVRRSVAESGHTNSEPTLRSCTAVVHALQDQHHIKGHLLRKELWTCAL